MNDAVKLAHWILENKKGTAFKDYDMACVCQEILECSSKDGLILYVEDEDQDIVGVCFGKLNHSTQELFVFNILTTEDWVLKEMLKDFYSKYPTYSIHGIKKNNIKRQFNNIQQLIERL